MQGIFLILSVLLLVFTKASGQFIFQNIREEDGLSAKEVRSLYSDESGFLWIGTSNGLNRFDGAVVKKYLGFDLQRNLFVTSIMPLGNKEQLLLGTDKGLILFNKQTGKFQKDARFAGVEKEIILAVKTDHRNRIWVVTTNDVFIYDNKTIRKARDAFASAEVIANKDFSSLAFIWDRSRKGFWLGGNNVYFIDCEKDVVYSKTSNPHAYPILDTPEVYIIAVDRQENLWYGSDKNASLYFWNKKSRKLTTYCELDGIRLNGFNNIFIDSRERIWLSTYRFAGFLKEPGQPFRKIPYDQNQKYSIGYGFFNEAIEDSEGNIWLGTINGVSKNPHVAPIEAIYQLPSFESFLETGFSHANSIAVDGENIMACKADGIIEYNMNRRSYKRYAVTYGQDLSRNHFDQALKVGQTWWFAGHDGIFYLDQGKLMRFAHAGPGPAPFIFQDKKGNIWFEIWDDAIYRYNPGSKKLVRFDGKDPKYGLFEFKSAISALVTQNGNVLFGVKGTGFLWFDTASEKFATVSVANAKDFDETSFAMLEDSRTNIWLAIRGRGLIKVDRKGTYLDSIDTSSGLVLDRIKSIAMDGRGFIWVATREGLVFFNPESKEVTNVNIDFGKTLQNYWNYVTVADGRVYLVMLDQIVVINPFLFSKIQVRKPPYITSVKVFEKEHNFLNGKLLEFDPDENYIRFQYASLKHRDIPSLQYKYQLIGIDKSWINAGRSLTAAYNKIPPGEYTLQICSTDANGKWMTEITSLKFKIRTPWWQTWWFLAIMAVLTGILLRKIYESYLRVRRQTLMEKTIAYFANSMYGDNIVNDICWDISRNCVSQLHFESCTVYLTDDSKQRLTKIAEVDSEMNRNPKAAHRLEEMTGMDIPPSIAALKEPLIISDTSARQHELLRNPAGLSALFIPVLDENNLIGLIISEHPQKGYFNSQQARTLMTIASISANKIAEAQAQQQAREKEKVLLEISKMLSDSQLVALRAQMNPHFVFNCLNSIQECIATESYKEASKYLNKFSKLFRVILNNSSRNLVTVAEEVQVLQLYLDLEQMRFENSFTYHIAVDPGLESEHTVLPSMLLQPYVENAIWHGLMHKEGARNLIIGFRKIDDEVFECRIEDNGVGRNKSLEIKEANSNAKNHKSKGMQISQDRLELLKRQGQFTRLEIIDKYDPAGNPEGTLIVIQLSASMEEI